MNTNRWRKTGHDQSGQSLVFLVLALGLVFVGAGALCVDMSNLWFHRQSAQNAADAACTAGAMDLLVDAQGLSTGHQGFTGGTAFNCTTGSTAAPCQYAAKNGYNSVNGTPGNLVSVSFPASVAGVPTAAIPPSTLVPNAFMRVDVTDNIQTYFSGLLSGRKTQTVRAFAVCGLVLSQSPTPLLILAPTGTTLSLSGTPDIDIVGGPQRSIQVNSSSATAVSNGGGIDLSLGGPNGTGSDFGVYGGPGAKPSNINVGTTGHYFSPSAPIADPFAQIPAPQQPTHVGTKTTGVATGVDGCPAGPCDEYTPGYYSAQIQVKNATAIFQPGIYYILGGLSMGPNSCVRPSTQVGDGSGGVMFYFADTNSASFGSNSGSGCGGTGFNSTIGTGSISFGAKCTAASTLPGNVPATLTGSVLLGPCQAPTVSTLCAPNCAINYGDPLGTSDSIGEQRGLLFFQNRSKAANVDFSGGGQFLLSGAMYFHQCVTTGADTGVGCSTAGAYNTSLGFGGNSGSGTIVGQIVTDSINMHGTPGITMDLDSTTSFNIIKASLLR